MHQVSEQPEFMKTVNEIKDAEEQHDRIINAAKEKADGLVREAKERILDETRKSDEAIISFKNDSLRKGSKEIEDAVAKITEHAKENGEKLGKKRVDTQTVSKIVKDFLNSL